MRIEAESLREMHRHCPEHIPEVYKFDDAMSTLAMQFLAPPHAIVRHSLLDGRRHPQLAVHAGEQLARCLFHTSMFKLDSPSFAALAARFSNPDMCQLTEQVRARWLATPLQDAPSWPWRGAEWHE